MQSNKKNHGGALLTALFIMTLVAIAATAMTTRLQLDIYRTRLVIVHDKLYLATQAVNFWAMSELTNTKNKFRIANTQGMVLEFPKNMQDISSPITLSGGLYDLQSRFNLNNLSDPRKLPSFINLMHLAAPNIALQDQVQLSQAVKNWLLTASRDQNNDPLLSYYLSQKPPYYPGHQLLFSLSELRLVKDAGPSLYQALEPFLTVLPESTPININTASKIVLMSLSSGMKPSQADSLIAERGNSGFMDMNKIGELLRKLDLPRDQVTLESKYFLSVAKAQSEEFNYVVYTLLKRGLDKNRKVSISIIRQSINTPI